MTDNEIVKVAEYKAKAGCGICDLNVNCCNDTCDKNLLKLCVDLITRQKAEIEALIAGQATLQKYIAKAKAEAIKEFADGLKKELTIGRAVMRMSVLNIIDNLVKEMVGDGIDL